MTASARRHAGSSAGSPAPGPAQHPDAGAGRSAVVAARVLGAGLALALVAGLGPASPAGALVLRDMRGREVTLPAAPRRIVSLVPSVTETIFALGGEDRLVGVSDFCDWPPAARRKPRVGGMVAPNLEVIVALSPDLVVATDAGNREETFAQLQRLRLPVYLVHASRLAEVMDVVARVGTLTGREDEVPGVVARLRQRIDAVRRAVAHRQPPRVLYALWPEPLIVPGRDALLTELITTAGGASISATVPGDYPRLSLEAAVARAPDVIVLARHGAGAPVDARDRWERLASLPAVRSGRVYSVNGDTLHRYGPRVVDGLAELARLFHPEAFR